MSAPAATILVPTFDHGALVRLALESAFAQTVAELEVFLVGDGAPDETRELAAELAGRDPRLRFFDNPKGPRHGEIHRHEALAEARGDVVLYLADDDLWLPDHVETMLTALADADFASALCLAVGADGTLTPAGSDFGRPEVREEFQRGGAAIVLSIMGHTLAAYRRLPTGWSTTPVGTATDRQLWGKFVSDPAFRGGGTSKVTAIALASPPRRHLSQAERFVETSGWWEKVCDAEGRAEIHAAAFSAAYQRVDRLGAKLEMTRRRNERLERRALKLEARLEAESRRFRLPRLRRR